jgi:UDP-N-acetylmuramate--alanine ligase
MSAIAIALAEMGHHVSGSDIREKPILDRAARRRRGGPHVGHQRAHVARTRCHHLEHRRSLSATSSATRPASAVRQSLHRSGMLASICAQAKSLAVAGTHGKTTTTSMLMLILAEAGLRPSFVIGGDVTDIGTGAQWTGGSGSWSRPTRATAPTSSCRLHGTILTNVEVDHLDHYGSFAGIVDGFDRYLAQIAGPEGRVPRRPGVRSTRARHGAITYGTSPRRHGRPSRRPHTRVGARSRSRRAARRLLGTVDLPLRGIHNVRNATGAIALAMSVGVPFEVAASALAKFGGVARRFDIRGVDDGATLVDDYGTPSFRDRGGARRRPLERRRLARVVVVFQPNRFNRIAVMWQDYADAFVDADVVVLTDIYAERHHADPGHHGQAVVNAVLDAHPDTRLVWLPEAPRPDRLRRRRTPRG